MSAQNNASLSAWEAKKQGGLNVSFNERLTCRAGIVCIHTNKSLEMVAPFSPNGRNIKTMKKKQKKKKKRVSI